MVNAGPSRRWAARARGPILAAAAIMAEFAFAPIAWSRPSPRPQRFPAACARLWTGVVKVVKWNPRYKITLIDTGKHLVVFSVGDVGKPSEGELQANPSTVGLGRGQCALAVGFVTGSIGGTALLRAEAVLFAKIVNMDTGSELATHGSGRLPPGCRNTWKAFVEVANAFSAYKPAAVDEKSHLLSLTLDGRQAVGWVEAERSGACRLKVKPASDQGTAGTLLEESVSKLTERVKLQERFDRLSRDH